MLGVWNLDDAYMNRLKGPTQMFVLGKKHGVFVPVLNARGNNADSTLQLVKQQLIELACREQPDTLHFSSVVTYSNAVAGWCV